MVDGVENYIPLLHKCVHNVYTTTILSREDLLNEAVLIFMTLDRPVELDSTFLRYAEISITGKLRNLLRKSTRKDPDIDEPLTDSEEYLYICDEISLHAIDILGHFRNTLDDRYEQDLFDGVILDNTMSVKSIVANHEKSMYTVYSKLNNIKHRFHKYVCDHINEELIPI